MKNAYIRRYLLSVETLQMQENEEMIDRALRRLDRMRREGLSGRQRNGSWYESLGAGVLLQKAVWDYQRWCEDAEGETIAQAWQSVSLTALCEELSEVATAPLELQYEYGAKGKPYFANIPLFFSLSHSKGQVLCVVCEREVGADIQVCQSNVSERIVPRFFSKTEVQAWQALDKNRQKDFFYRVWTRKEAYGKLLGDGVVAVLGQDMFRLQEEVMWEEYQVEDAYVAICIATAAETSTKWGGSIFK